MAPWQPTRWLQLVVGLPTPWLILWLGLFLLSVALVVLMRTRWGQSQPLRKCAVLSLLAHCLFACFATTVKIVTDTAGAPEAPAVWVTVEATPEEAAARTEGDAEKRPSWDVPPSALIEPETALPDPAELAASSLGERAANDALAPLLSELPERTAAETPEEPNVAEAQAAAAIDRAEPSLAAETIEAPEAQREEAQTAEVPLPETERPGLLADQSPAPERSLEEGLPAPRIEPHELAPQLSDLERSSNAETALAASEDLLRRATSPAAAETLQALAGNSEQPQMQPDQGSPSGSAALVAVKKPSGATGDTRTGGQDGDLGPSLMALARDRKIRRDVPQVYEQRVAPNRVEIATQRGGGPDTEAAVEAALAWLAANQNADGRWDADRHGAGREQMVLGHDRQGAGARADTAITGLAVLAFLGAGYTHQDGPHAETVGRALDYLRRVQATDGNLYGDSTLFARMYCHGMATLALGEAYAMTRDERLEPAVRRAIQFTLAAQHPTSGSWRYQPGDEGDTSQLGWQVMALKSAELAGIDVPASTRLRIVRYLDSVTTGTQGGLARYRPGHAPTRPMTAEALFCRQLLGLERGDAASAEAAEYLQGELPGVGQANFYYWYYATLALYQTQGEAWTRWNTALKATLLESQRKTGDLTGSWDPNTVWGGYGGRVYTTAMAALSLEVYYRYLPIYSIARRPADRWR